MKELSGYKYDDCATSGIHYLLTSHAGGVSATICLSKEVYSATDNVCFSDFMS